MARKTKKPTRKAAPKKKAVAKRAVAPARSTGAVRKVIVVPMRIVNVVG